VLSAIGGVDSVVHRRLQSLGPSAVYSVDPRPQTGLQTHITTQWQRQLEGQGLLLPKCIYQRRGRGALVVPDWLRERGAAAQRAILVHPGSGGRAKCWHLRGFLAVGRELQQMGLDVRFIIGPVERERWSPDELSAIRGAFAVVDLPQPDELVALLAAARLLISNDAGPAHLAALLATPTLTLFGPTAAGVWRPLGPGARVIAGDPASRLGDWGISPARVMAAVDI